MSDYGERARESVERQLELRLKQTYTQAQKDILRKLDDFTSKFNRKDKIMRSQMDKGLISEDEYQRWLAGQVFMGAQWEEKVKDITDMLCDVRGDDLKMIHDSQISVFKDNANYQAYKMEHDIGKNFGFDLYDEDTVKRLIREKPELLPRKIVDKKKHNFWNQGIISNCVTQGIIQGESIPKIAKRIANTTANHDLNASTLYARTAMTSAQNSGRMEMLREAKDKGINVKKKWMSTHDARTRDSHVRLDGQVQEVEKPFKSDFGKIEYPGDPKAHPGDVYNCRCTLVYVYPDYDDLSEFPDLTEEEKGMSVEKRLSQESGKQSDAGNELPLHEKLHEIDEIKVSEKLINSLKEDIEKNGDNYELDDIIKNGGKVREIAKQAQMDEHGADWFDNLKREIEEKTAENEKINERVKELNGKLDEMRKTKPLYYGAFKDKADQEEYDRIRQEIFDLTKVRSANFAKIKENQTNIDGKNSEAIFAAVKKIRKMGGIDENNIFEFIEIMPDSKKKELIKKNMMDALNFYPADWLEQSKSEKVLKVMWSNGRGEYWGGIDTNDTIATAVHELGHHWESKIMGVSKSAKEFYKKRTDGEKEVWLGKGYKRDERTKKDKFVNPYMGKVYDDGETELISMGYQYLFTDFNLLAQDEEYLNWVLGMLVSCK